MHLKHFFQLIRWKNLVLIALAQFLIKYYLLSNFEFTRLTYPLFYLLIASTLLITASGYIINDIFDYKIDAINKPKRVIVGKNISISNAKKLYFSSTIIGILLGCYLSFIIGNPLFSIIFITISFALYIYSKYLKGKILIGNLLVSILLAMSILILLLFDTQIQTNPIQMNVNVKILNVVILYAIFAFLLNFIREIIKDIEDVNGDYNQHLKTFPIVFGRKFARNFAIFISFSTLFFFLFGIFANLNIATFEFGYTFIFIFLPLLYFTYKLMYATHQKEYSYLSKVLTIIILLGILSIPFISKHILNAFN